VNCKSLFDKKIDKIKAKSDFERIRKLKNYLNSRGFEVSTINNVLDQE
jgi:SOS response regulatory protein OraA/RecX